MLKWADNVVEQSTTTTTGAYQLGGVPAAGEPPGAQTFVAGIGDAQTCYYYAKEMSGTAWERGIGTVADAATDTLTRTTIHGSSNGGSAVDWTGKTLRVYCVAPAYALRRMTLDHAGLLDNATITAARNLGAETFHLKTASGADPSPSDPVRVAFANATGGFDVLEVTAALSLTFSSGSTGGAISGLEFKAGVLLLNNAGTVAMGVVVRPSGIRDNSVVSTTAEGGAGTADSPRVIYSASALTNVRARVVGYHTYTLATSGTWDTAPTDTLLTRAGVIETQVRELLYEKTLTAAGTFDTAEWWPSGTLPSGYDRLEFDMMLRGADNGLMGVLCQLNGDTTAANYRCSQVNGGTGGASGAATDLPKLAECGGADNVFADNFGSIRAHCLFPASNKHKVLSADVGLRRDTDTTTYKILYGMYWENTAAINRIQLVTGGASTNFAIGSRVQIFGCKTVGILT